MMFTEASILELADNLAMSGLVLVPEVQTIFTGVIYSAPDSVRLADIVEPFTDSDYKLSHLHMIEKIEKSNNGEHNNLFQQINTRIQTELIKRMNKIKDVT